MKMELMEIKNSIYKNELFPIFPIVVVVQFLAIGVFCD